MLFYFLWTALPLIVLGQTYYINFVFNNNRYGSHKLQESGKGKGSNEVIKSPHISNIDSETIEVSSEESKGSGKHKHSSEPETIEVTSKETSYDDSKEKKFTHTTAKNGKGTKTSHRPHNTDEEYDYLSEEWIEMNTRTSKGKAKKGDTTTKSTKDTLIPNEITTTSNIYIRNDSDGAIEITTTASTNNKGRGYEAKPHPLSFRFPNAVCHEDLNIHELFGITLERDRGLPSKVLCDFDNSWGGPWLLMTRLDLPSRIHMRHWFFGYITEDYLDMNTNFLALAHIMNNMRIAMLIIGQDNNDQLVYNLYDDVVISGFNDLFMLRKAHLIEANTTDLLFSSVGEVLETDTGRNRTCPFKVAGAWWGSKWIADYSNYCVFPTDRDITRPGYMAIFIKPSPFEVNNTAFYNQAITTRRPWAATKIPSKNQAKQRENEFLANKDIVINELRRRLKLTIGVEKERRQSDYVGIQVKTLAKT